MHWTEKMIEAIDRYIKREFGNSQSCDTNNLREIQITYTFVDEDNEHDTQVYADVIGLAIEYQVDGKTIQIDKFETPENMLRFLEDMTFEELYAPGFWFWQEKGE